MYRAVFESAGDAILLVDPDGRCIDANRAARSLLGCDRGESLSMRIADVVLSPSDRASEEFLRLLDRGGWAGEIQLRRRDGSLIPVEASATTVAMDPGPIHAVVLRDLTDREQIRREREELRVREREARSQAEEARQQVRLVSDVSVLLAVSNEYPATLFRLADLMVREVADLCLIDLLDEAGTLHRVAAVHASQAKQPLADRLGDRRPRRPEMSDPIGKALLTGEPNVVSSVSQEWLQATVPDDEDLRTVRELGVQSFLAVPLMARSRTLGVLSLISTNPDIRYGDRDVRLAEEIARRAAVRIDNARLYEERDRTAKVLQRSLLPPDLPAIPHVELAARYLPVGEGNEVGGDFYDVFDCGDGSWAAVVGDVCGKGPEAAAVMGMVRHTLRALARFQRRPSTLLRELNRSMLEHGVDGRFCTLCYLRVRPSAGRVHITLAPAGHPLPIVVRADGQAEPTGRPGQLLGVFPDVSVFDSVVDLEPGDALVIYTDGAIEERSADPVTGEWRLEDGVGGEERLRDAVAGATGRDAEAIAARIEDMLRSARRGSPPVDDVALLVVRATGMRSEPPGDRRGIDPER